MSTSISSDHLYAQLGLPASSVIVDVRREDDYAARPRLLPSARRGDPEHIAQWSKALPRTRPVVVYCAHGRSVSQSAAKALTALGYEASYLDGGIESWTTAQHATVRARAEFNAPGGSRWVTRARPKIDRLACPWLVRRFIDPDALFFYTPAHRVRTEAEALGAQPYDIADVMFSHRGPRCSFDAFLDEFDLHDPVLDAVADIVRAADTATLEKSPQAPGLLAISLGLSANISDDGLLLEQAIPIYDALYAWCKTAKDETHAWPQKKY
ncbi:MAG: chromate resistance protein [Gammaproteobacteria bacterium]|nr:chromate resistance protein [Gammaproteobacteria bacterium]